MPKGRKYTSHDPKTGFEFREGKIWIGKDHKPYRYIYSNIHGKKSRTLMVYRKGSLGWSWYGR